MKVWGDWRIGEKPLLVVMVLVLVVLLLLVLVLVVVRQLRQGRV